AVLDKPAIDVDAAGLAHREQPPVAVALPTGAVDGAAAGQLDQRVARGAAAAAGLAALLADLDGFRRIATPQPNTLAPDRDRIAVLDHGVAGDVPGGDAVDGRGDKQEQAEDRSSQRVIEEAAQRAARARRPASALPARCARPAHRGKAPLIIRN